MNFCNVYCTCGYAQFLMEQPVATSKQALTSEAKCASCNKKWALKLELVPIMPDNIRDAGPTAFGGRNAGLKRDH